MRRVKQGPAKARPGTRKATGAHTGRCFATPAALNGYRHLMPPAIPAGVAPGRIDVGNPYITSETCLALHAAGWNKIAARDGLTPAKWLQETMAHHLGLVYTCGQLPADPKPAISLDVQINAHEDHADSFAWVGMSAATACNVRYVGKVALDAEALHPGLGACLIHAIGRDGWLITPDEVFGMAAQFYWGGEEDESYRVEEEAAHDDEYCGVTRKDFDEAYPLWAYHPASQAAACETVTDQHLRQLARTAPPPFNAIARHCLDLRKSDSAYQSSRTAPAYPSDISLDDLGFEDVWAYGGVAYWSAADNLTESLSDDAYQMAMQCNSSDFNVLLGVPAALIQAQAKDYISILETYVARFAIINRLFSLLPARDVTEEPF